MNSFHFSASILNFGALRLVLLSSALCLAALAPAACGDSTNCTPGQSISCAGNGCMGHQVCAADGKAYGECQCDSSQSQFPAKGPSSGLIGAACTGAPDCRGFDCLAADSKVINGSGPSAGICLARCIPEHDFCKELDARSKCIVVDNGGTTANTLDDIAYCLPGCQMGTQANDLDKCRGRVDMVCSESLLGSGTGYCIPACRADLDCAGRHCNLESGLCQDTAPAGDPIGAACTPGQATSCSGKCVDEGAAYAECTGSCSFGTPGCGQNDNTLPLKFYCYKDPSKGLGTAPGSGDLGYCAKLCDRDADCGRTDAACEPQPSLKPKTGRAGVCGSKMLPGGGVRPNSP